MSQKSFQVVDTTRLEQLLDDDRFRLNLQPVDIEKEHAQECLDLYVKGDLKECLELMYEYGLLNSNKMQTSLKSWQLMMDCVSQMNNVGEIGTSLDKRLKEWFTNEELLLRIIKTKPLSDQLIITYQFFYSSLKFWKRNVKQNYEHIDELSISCKELILQTSRRCQTVTEIQNLSQILDFLIFDVQIETLQKKASITMYTRFCQLDDKLQSKLKANKVKHAQSLDIDTYFCEKLQPKPKPKPKSKSRSQKPKNQVQIGAATSSTSTTAVIAPASTQRMNLSYIRRLTTYLPRWLPVWAQSVQWSPQLLASIIIFTISMVLPIARRSKTFNIIWMHSKDKASTIVRLFIHAVNTLASL
ncbi:Pex15 [Kluyveromyces lactis]|nr:Pex15 [Kluyveromyces lactis]